MNFKVELKPVDIEMLNIFSNGTKTIVLEVKNGRKYICDKEDYTDGANMIDISIGESC
jgi:hypothetical protein